MHGTLSQRLLWSPFQRIQRPGWTTVVTPQQLAEAEQYLDACSLQAWDYEADGLEWWNGARPVGVGFAARAPGDAVPRCWYVPWRHRTGQPQLSPDVVEAFTKRQLHRHDVERVAHNAKFELQMSWAMGWQPTGIVHDTLPQARLLDENRPCGLKALMVSDLGDPAGAQYEEIIQAEIERLAKLNGLGKTAYLDKRGYGDTDIWLTGLYGCGDVWGTWWLHDHYGKLGVRDYYRRVYETERILCHALGEAQWVGVQVDPDRIHKVRLHAEDVMQQATEAFKAITGATIELTNNQQLLDVLQSRGAQITAETESGEISVSADALRAIQGPYPEAGIALTFREAQKIHGTYCLPMLELRDKYDLIHAEIKSEGANTGRMSSLKPNMQNTPEFQPVYDMEEVSPGKWAMVKGTGRPDPLSIRYVFVERERNDPYWPDAPKKRVRLSNDYSQIELRVLCQRSRDPRMLHAYLNNLDIHDETERAIFNTGTTYDDKGGKIDGPHRRLAKVINFGLAFGMTPKGFAKQTGVSIELAEQYFAIYFEKFTGMRDYRTQLWAFATANGGKFDNLFGRTRRIPDLLSLDKWELLRAQRQCIASDAQGSAADLMKEATARLWLALRQEGLPAKLVLLIHDDAQLSTGVDVLARVARVTQEAMTQFQDVFTHVPVMVEQKWWAESWDGIHVHKIKGQK